MKILSIIVCLNYIHGQFVALHNEEIFYLLPDVFEA